MAASVVASSENFTRAGLNRVKLIRPVLITLLLSVTAMLYLRDQRRERPALPVPVSAPSNHAAPVQREDFVNDEAPGKICHVCALAPLGQSRMAAVWYAGSREGAADV